MSIKSATMYESCVGMQHGCSQIQLNEQYLYDEFQAVTISSANQNRPLFAFAGDLPAAERDNQDWSHPIDIMRRSFVILVCTVALLLCVTSSWATTRTLLACHPGLKRGKMCYQAKVSMCDTCDGLGCLDTGVCGIPPEHVRVAGEPCIVRPVSECRKPGLKCVSSDGIYGVCRIT